MKFLVAMLIASMIMPPAAGAEKEIEVQELFCAGMSINQMLADGSEADCVTKDYAIEVDFSDHWAEAIGQSLHYASELERRPGIILVCRSDVPEGTCLRHKLRLVSTISYWRIGMMLWTCMAGFDHSLADCRREDLFGPD